MARFACAILSKDNLLHNLNIVSKLAPKSKIIAMVKANAYGHGLRSVSKHLDDLNFLFLIYTYRSSIELDNGIKAAFISCTYHCG